jgi:hypothetical protein
MKHIFFYFIFICLFTNKLFAQSKTGFSIDPNANNIAALFTMTDEGGRLKNLELMESVFKDGSLGFKSERHHNVSSAYIYSKMTELASNLDEDATLLLYFNSHGGGSGDRFGMTAQGGSFKFSKGLEALKKSDKIIKRLIFLVDTCHAEGSIQDSLKQDGDLLRNIQLANPTNFLPELPSEYSRDAMPFVCCFLNRVQTGKQKGWNTYNIYKNIDYGEDSGIYEEILIISSSSVEDLSMRGTFASRLANTFEKVKNNKDITLGEFLKQFAESHSKSGQQPYYKILPEKSMLNELLFGPSLSQTIKIVDRSKNSHKFPIDYVPTPRIISQ